MSPYTKIQDILHPRKTQAWDVGHRCQNTGHTRKQEIVGNPKLTEEIVRRTLYVYAGKSLAN